MGPTQTAPAEQQVYRENPLDSIVENTEARKAAEGAKANALMAQAHAQMAKVYAPQNEMASQIIGLGADFGMNAAMSLASFDLIGGKLALKAVTRGRFLHEAGYRWVPVKHDATVCRLRFKHIREPLEDADGKPLEVEFSFAQAEKAGYVTNSRGTNKQGNYDKIPENMLFARCISNFHRWYAPHVYGSTIPDKVDLTLEAVAEATDRIGEKSDAKIEALKERLIAAVEAPAEAVAK